MSIKRKQQPFIVLKKAVERFLNPVKQSTDDY